MSRVDDDDNMEVESKGEKPIKTASIFNKPTRKQIAAAPSSSSSSSSPAATRLPAPFSVDKKPGYSLPSHRHHLHPVLSQPFLLISLTFPSLPCSCADTSHLPWVEKYRPSQLDDLISHHSIISTIQSLISKNRLPHLLLYGPAGTGKTSTILAIARQLFGPRYSSHILELNASDDRGIDVVRDQIKDFASSRQLFASGFKLIILDEADNMTKVAQFALRRIIEKYTRGTRFCLIANYVNKIIPALQSRCTKFRFGPLETAQVETRMREIATKEGVDMTEDGMRAIVKLSEGDMRKCLNVLQSTAMSWPKVDEAAVYSTTGNPSPATILHILQTLLNQPLPTAYSIIIGIQRDVGLSLIDIITYLHELVLRTGMPDAVLRYLLAEMADAEYRLAGAASERIQLAGVVGMFARAKEMIHEEEQAQRQRMEADASIDA